MIIIESSDFSSIENLIEESENNKKDYYIKGVFIESEVKNRNGRYYPKKVIEKELKDFKKLIEEKRSLGELGHPDNTQINLERVSHLITEMNLKDNIVYGKAKIIDTPYGQIAKKLIDNGIKLGVSSRGTGSVIESVVQNDFKLITIDIVHSPSAPSAFVEGILENEWVVENGILKEVQRKKLLNDLDKYTREEKETALIKIFKDFFMYLINKNI